MEELEEGLRFYGIGGAGKITCSECGFSEEITSFVHGTGASVSAYQCQTCGKFASREYINPFPKSRSCDSSRPLEEVPLEYRPSQVQNLLMVIGLIEGQMQTTPKENWRTSWAENLAHFRGELACIPAEELERIRLVEEESDAAYKASLFCECGGSLSREHVIFCPKCGATHMLYKCEYLT